MNDPILRQLNFNGVKEKKGDEFYFGLWNFRNLTENNSNCIHKILISFKLHFIL